MRAERAGRRQGRCALPVALSLALALAGALAHASAGAQEALAACLACHGSDGQSRNAGVPSLGGQQRAYLVTQLYLFREGLRTGAPMATLLHDWNDEALQAAAARLAALPPPAPPAAPLDAARLARGRALVQQHHCAQCHGPHFSGHDGVPRIGAQREDYLARTLRDFKGNVRAGYDGTMAEVLQPVSPADIDDLAYLLARAP